MGDFYEMFYDDAKTAARVLNLALTSREKGENAVPMAGFPHHQLESYLAKLIAAGMRAAVCEQVEDPKLAKGLVRREVTRIVTPGTVTDDALLDPRESNFLAAVAPGDPVGLAWVELSTGRFVAAGFSVGQLPDQLARIAPAECLVERRCGSAADAFERADDGHPPPDVGLFPTDRPAGAGQAFFHGKPGRFRILRRPGRRPGDPCRRGRPRLSHRDAEKFLGPHRAAAAVPQFGHAGDRRIEPPQPGDYPHHSRRPPRRLAALGARSNRHRDGLAAAGRVGCQSVVRCGVDPRAVRRRRGTGRRPIVVRRPARESAARVRRGAVAGPGHDGPGQPA